MQQVQTRPPASLQRQSSNQTGTIESLLRSPQISEQIKLALPKHFDSDRLLSIALTEIRRNPKLAECSQASLLGALFQCAQLGLEIGGSLGQAYLVPYGRDAQFQLGYRGMINLAMRSGRVASIEAHAVFQGDEFHCTFGLHSDLQHTPDWENPDRNDPKKLTFVYAVAHLTDSKRPQFVVMSRAEIEAIRKRSKGGSSGPWETDYEAIRKRSKGGSSAPWVTDYEAMALAKVTKRLFKWLPVSIELARAVAADDAADAGQRQESPIDHLLPQQEEPAPAADVPVTVTVTDNTPAPAEPDPELGPDLVGDNPPPAISQQQLETIIGAMEKRLGAVGAEAFVTEVCAVLSVEDLSQLPADQFSAVMKSLADDAAVAAWSEGKSRQGRQLISAERIQELLSNPSGELPLQPEAMPEFD
jgi:recombination protein RecT